MSRNAVAVVCCLAFLTGYLAGGAPGCPAIGPDGDRVAEPVCQGDAAGGLSLSLDRTDEAVRVTATNVGDEPVAVNPDRWVVFREAAEGSNSGEAAWRPVANAPAGTHNLTVSMLEPGDRMTWELRYAPDADPTNRRDATLARPGRHVFSLRANNRTYVVAFEVEG
ncbi:hypothetical protein ABNG03_02170 [Halorubrum sp. RMP-47]|uniref:Uncharacterized protein n=1 Tax=Halorubrum miltondacostae TaxID=3076378 RepID=A0ABD5M0B1_9EURY